MSRKLKSLGNIGTLTVGPDSISELGGNCNIDTSSTVNVECVLVCKFYGSDRVFTRVHLFYNPRSYY